MTTRFLSAGLTASSILSLVAGCCWPGSIVSLSDFDYVHPSVRWVRCAGGQVGTVLSFPAIIENRIDKIWTDEHCIAIKERAPGCIVQGFLRPIWTVDADDGHLMLRFAPQATEYAMERWINYILENDFTIDVGNEFELHCRPPYQELLISCPGAPRDEWIRLITISEKDTRFGWVDRCILIRKDRLVFSWGDRHILCVDMSRLKPDLESYHQARKNRNSTSTAPS
ncbi:MAG: hypothetical protein ACYTA5_16135 [Planctomycetota bacterium]